MRQVEAHHLESRAHTLLELIVALSLFGLIMGGAVNAFVSTMRSTEKLHRHLDNLEGAYLLLTRLETDLRQAREIPGRPFFKYGIRFSADSRSLSFRRPHRRGRQPGGC